MQERLKDKHEHLREIVKGCGSVLIAYSGGVDSSFLAKVAHDVLGGRALAVTSVSPSLPASELQEAKRIAEGIGIAHRLVETREMDDPQFLENSTRRCFFCKTELFQELFRIARDEGYQHVLYGANIDDTGDFRPGEEAAKGSGALAPLRDAGFTKEEIRLLSRELGLPTWNKPSRACLSSRIPFGEKITAEKLHQVEKAEEALSRLGFHQFRVRHHGPVARIEIQKEELEKIMRGENRAKVVEDVRKAGFQFITLDLEGYRTGPFNPPSQSSGSKDR